MGSSKSYHIIYLFLFFKCENVSPISNGTMDITLAMDFKQLCPNTDLCPVENSSISENHTDYDMYYFYIGEQELACCSDCLCTNCDRDCCPGVNLKPLDEEEIVAIKTNSKDCKYPQLRPFDGSKKNVDPVEMIIRCPDSFKDANVTTKCEENYILNSNSGSNTLNLLRPVSSKMNNLTFNNYFCAKCHGLDDNSITQWETTLTCDSMASEIPNIQSFRDIYSQLAIHDHCNVAFRPPLDFYPQVCEYGISRCNQTGKWRMYDDMLEKACLSYTSTYKFQYKNVHCALCNGIEREDVEPFCGSIKRQMDPISSQFSFLALLDFTGLEDGEDQFESDCSSGMIYDIFQRKCHEIFCPKSYYLDGNECRPVINGESRYTFGPFSVISMDIMFHLKPLGSLGEDSLSTFESSSDTNVPRIIYNKLMIPPLGQHRQARVEICNLRSFLKMTKSMNETIEQIRQTNESALLSNIDFIGVHVQLKVFDFTNLTSLIDYTASVIRGTDLMFQDLHLIYQAFDDLTFLDYHTTLGFDFKRFLRVIDLNASAITTTRLLASFDGADGLGIMPLFSEEDTWPCQSSISIFPTRRCPLVAFPKTIANVLTEDATVEVIVNGHYLHFYRWILSENGQEVFVCWNEYLQNMEKQTSNDDDIKTNGGDTGMTILTIVCLCFSVVSLIITFLVYSVLPPLRSLPGMNNMALVITLFIAHCLTLVNTLTESVSDSLCIVIGLLLHFSLLSSFAWMFICSFHMMKVFITITDRSLSTSPSRQFVKYLAWAELFSTTVVVLHILVSKFTIDDIGYGANTCYIDSSRSIVYFVGIPIGVIVILNIVMFLFVVVKVSTLPEMGKGSSTHDRNNLTIFFKLSTITGMTWIFGFLYQFIEFDLFAYLFIILNAGQGVFIMLSFVVNVRVFRQLCALFGIRVQYLHTTDSTKLTTTNSVKTVNLSKN